MNKKERVSILSCKILQKLSPCLISILQESLLSHTHFQPYNLQRVSFFTFPYFFNTCSQKNKKLFMNLFSKNLYQTNAKCV